MLTQSGVGSGHVGPFPAHFETLLGRRHLLQVKPYLGILKETVREIGDES